MFDAFACPVSVLMKVLHDLLSQWLGADSGASWVGAIVLLVCVLRLVLLRPAWTQLVAGRRTALLQPRLAALKREHGADQQAYLRAVAELRRDEGAGVLSGCLPLLLQLPVFIGLYHLLAAFTVLGASGGNGRFGPAEVQSFAHATLAAVPLSAAISTPTATLAALHPGLTSVDVLLVVLPLLLVAALVTFVNAWRAQRRQPVPVVAADDSVAVDDPVAASMRRLTSALVWVSPLGLLISGIVFPVPLALVLYWAVNGSWSTIQTQLMTARLDRVLPLSGTPRA